jgi:hypothetical protein
LWVSYSSLIVFFGATFTKVWNDVQGHPIMPNSFAERLNNPTPPIVGGNKGHIHEGSAVSSGTFVAPRQVVHLTPLGKPEVKGSWAK